VIKAVFLPHTNKEVTHFTRLLYDITKIYYPSPPKYGIKQRCDTSVRLSLCLCHASSSKTVHFRATVTHYTTLTENHMLQVEVSVVIMATDL